MRAADFLIEEIVASAGIPRGKRRRDVERELRCHVDDFVLMARGSGHSEEEIERMVLANFGDPREIGRNFAWVYRHERALLGLCVFGLSTLAVTVVIAAAILAVQAGVAAGFGGSFLKALTTRHTVSELADIVATVAAYAGILWLEKIFPRRSLLHSIAPIALIGAALLAFSAAGGIRAAFLIFGIANAIVLRVVQSIVKAPVARFGSVALGFGFLGVFLWARWPHSAGPVFASWLVMGAGYQLMTSVAARIDRELSNRLQRI